SRGATLVKRPSLRNKKSTVIADCSSGASFTQQGTDACASIPVPLVTVGPPMRPTEGNPLGRTAPWAIPRLRLDRLHSTRRLSDPRFGAYSSSSTPVFMQLIRTKLARNRGPVKHLAARLQGHRFKLES